MLGEGIGPRGDSSAQSRLWDLLHMGFGETGEHSLLVGSATQLEGGSLLLLLPRDH